MTGHYITWMISKDSLGPEVEMECREPADADCRSHCPNCEEWSHDPADHSLCECGTPLVTGQECNALLFMDGEFIDNYGGPDNAPVRNGLVEVQWEGEDFGYSWHYPEPDDQPTLTGETP